MKRFFLLLSFLLIGIVQTFAYDFVVNGIYYNILSGTTNVEVTHNNGQNNSYSGSVTIPSSVSYGGTTYSVTSIGSYAFRNCSGLTSVVIPSSVTSIGESAFYKCSGLTSIVIPSSVTSIGQFAFSCCSSLTSVVIPSSVTSISNEVFAGCSGLTSVEIPSSVTTIYGGAFFDCSGLTSIVIPSSVTSIGNTAFSGCSGLTSISVDAANTVYDSRNNCNAIIKKSNNQLVAGCKNTVIPSSVTSIGSSAFYDCSGLTSVVIPSSVTSIGNYAFFGCSSLTSIDIPSSVTSIGSSAFRGCSGLTSVVIPSSVTSIGNDAFYKCSGLTSVVIPSSVTSIGDYAFSYCSGLTSVVIPSSVTSIGSSAFSYCSGLTSVVIPSSVTSIGSSAFRGCSGLTSVVIPSSVTSIGSYAFSDCAGLTSVTMLCPPPSNIMSANIRSAATIYVTRANYDTYTALGLSNRIEVFDDNILYLDEQELQAGTDATLSLKLKNNVDITSLQFDLVLPEGITIPNSSNGKTNIEVSTNRTTTSKHKVYCNPQEDGSLRVICASLGNYAFSETDGEVLKIKVRVAADATVGDHEIILKNIELTQPDNTQHEVEQVQYSVTVTERARQKGDVNNDGLINAVDVDLAGQILLQKLSYDFFADMDNNGSVTIGDVAEIIRVATEPKPEEHEYVDLGLPSGTLWATCNVGADSPEDYGYYFAWGETQPKSTYNWSTYKWMKEGYSDWKGCSKYTVADNQTSGCWYNNGTFIGDNKTELDLEDDAAYMNWGEGWRMPSDAQLTELRTNCIWTWTTQNGKNGYLVKSKNNGASLFLPAAGYYGGSSLNIAGSNGYYWSRSLVTSYSYDACYVYFNSGGVYRGGNYRYYGQSVRPVRQN